MLFGGRAFAPGVHVAFAEDLKNPGLRVPITAAPAVFGDAISLGREVVWVHCYGERMVDAEAGRPKGPPRLDKGEAPRIPSDGALPGSSELLPEAIDYEASTKRLLIGNGCVENVTEEVWNYEVSGKNVLRQWFSYRKRDRSRPVIGEKRVPSPLDGIQSDSWIPEYTTDLMDLLHVLGRVVRVEKQQAELLERICTDPLVDVDEVTDAGALAMPPSAVGGRARYDSRGQLSLLG